MKGSGLVLITNHYPFGQGESFLEHEMPYLAAGFESILIVSKNSTSPQTHQLPLNVTVERISARSTFFQNLKTAFYCLKNSREFTTLLKEELRYVKQRNKRAAFGQVFHFLFKAFELNITLKNLLTKHRLPEKICFYSYWSNNSALAIALLKNDSAVRISRAHGGDLYEYRQADNYLPFRQALVKKLNRIYPVSVQGEKYLKDFFNNAFDSKIERAYLGTIQPAMAGTGKKNNHFTIVSCSNLIELKRVHLIIESMALLTEQVSWIHFGDGPLRKQLETLAHEKLSGKQNLTFTFKGFVSNAELIDFYTHNHVDVFINNSRYEGIPVSMMEAQSFGIPIIGTDVGAVSEIVTPQTGKLLPENSKPETIAASIQNILSQSPEATAALRQACKMHWEANFKAANNFSTFATQLNVLLNETSG